MRFGQFRKLFATALDGAVLLLDGVGHGALLAGAVLGAGVDRHPGQAMLQFPGLRQPGQGVVELFYGACSAWRFGGDQQPFASAQRAPGVGRQFEAAAARFLAAGMVVDAGDIAERQAAVLVAAAQLGLDGLLRIVEYQVIRAATAQLAAAQAGQGALLRQLPGRRIGAVVDNAGHDGMVDIAILELHHHFLAHARQRDLPHLYAGHRHHDAYPRRTALVEFAQAVPVKLQADAAQRIGVDFLAGRADHQRRLHPGHQARLAVVAAAGPPAPVLAHANKTVFVVGRRVAAGLIIVAGDMLDRQDQVFARLDVVAARLAALVSPFLPAEMAGQGKTAARLRLALVAGRFEILAQMIAFLHAALGQQVAMVDIAVAIRTGVFIQFMGGDVALAVQAMAGGALRTRVFIVEAGQGQQARTELAHGLPLLDAIVFHRAGAGMKLHRALGLAIDQLGQGAVVGQPQGMAIQAVLIPVVPAQCLPAPVQMVVVGFIVLVGA